MAACVPKPEEIKGCGSGMEFNETSKTCVTIASIDLDTTLTTLTVTEDAPESFSLPNATTDSVEGTLFWFITAAPTKGDLTGCANLNVSGELTATGTVFRSCVYTPDANYVGPDSFSYRICSSADAKKRCTSAYTVAVTVEDDENDVPILGGPALLNINEGSVFNYDVRVSRKTKNEADNFYLCVDIIDPDGALDTPGITNVNVPADPITINDATCSLLGAEDDNLSNVLATFSSDTFTLPGGVPKTAYIMMRLCETATCPVGGIDGIDNDADLQIDEEDEWSATDLLNVSVVRSRVNVNDLNFAPVMMLGALPGTPTFAPVSLGSVVEDSTVLTTIGTDAGVGVNDHVLAPYATDADGDAITYEIVPLTFFPSHAGTLLCPSGAQLACTFAPAADFSGTISFRYRARDATNKLSNEISVSLSFTAVNDAPVFLASQVLDYSTATPATQVFLQEVTTLSDRTFKVGEGGGITENSQTLRLRATSSDATILAPQGIRVKRGGVELGLLSDVTDLVLDSPSTDADALFYTLSFRPNGFTVTDTPVTITLSLSDGFNTTTQDITFLGVTNLNSPVLVSMPTTLGMKSGGATKDIEITANPGINDWDDVTGGGQGLAVTVTSSNTAVINLLSTNLTTAGGGISIVKDVGNCAAASCLYNITYDGSNDPGDDVMDFSLVSGIRGNSNLTFTFSDGVGASVVKTVAVGSYTFAVAFNGWDFLTANGVQTNADGSVFAPGHITPAWRNLTVTEGGVQTTAYKVFLYRKSNSDFSDITDYPAAAMNEVGVPSTQNSLKLETGVTFFDTTTLVPGERFYVAIGIVPNVLGEMIVAPGVVDTAIEVIVPPDNTALIHRWSANRVYCSLLGGTPDRNNNYRCLNVGLGGFQDGATYYHDAKEHVFLDNFETGCPYTGSNVEDGLFMAPGASGDVHYNRNTGACSYSDGVSWLPFTEVAYTLNTGLLASRGRLPPLTGLTRTQAQAVCVSELPQCLGAACPNGVGDVWEGTTRELPSRREMLVANTWPDDFDAPEFENSGLHTPDLLSCNTNSANGQVFRDLADTSLSADTITASPVATIRSLSNSALVAGNCKSLFNVYNLVGNVNEWLADSYSCTSQNATQSSCDMLAPVGSQAGGLKDVSLAANNSLGVTYSFDGSLRNGPLLVKDTAALFSNLFRPTIDRLYLALGLPFYEDGTVPHPSQGLPRIGTNAPPASYAATLFSSDTYRLNWISDTSSAATQYAMLQGGDWLSGSGAGRYNFELKQDGVASTQVGHRCVIRLTPELNP